MLKIIQGDCNKVMRNIRRNTIDTIITDPPYALKFMGKEWDYELPSVKCFKRMLRIAKPGAVLLCFGGTRTFHRIACNIEDAGWMIKDCILWLYGSGFPKSHNISKAIDKAKGKKRKVIGTKRGSKAKDTHLGAGKFSTIDRIITQIDVTAPTSKTAKLWNGWGTGLKPAFEPIILAMKPLEGTYAQNAEKHAVAGLNIDGGRIISGQPPKSVLLHDGKEGTMFKNIGGAKLAQKGHTEWKPGEGRWPANIILSCLCTGAVNVDLESPYAGNIKKNLKYARRCMSDSLSRGENPIASHLLYTQSGILNDRKPKERKRGIRAGKAWASLADATIVYTDLGISKGMRIGIRNAESSGRCIIYRSLKTGKEKMEHASSCPVSMLDKQSGISKSSKKTINYGKHKTQPGGHGRTMGIGWLGDKIVEGFGDFGGASRFFYTAKASKKERNLGLEKLSKKSSGDLTGRKEGSAGMLISGTHTAQQNNHPTVKPLKLMEYLCKLTKTPTGGIVLDPFMGSGTTGIACKITGRHFIGIELDTGYCKLARLRMKAYKRKKPKNAILKEKIFKI